MSPREAGKDEARTGADTFRSSRKKSRATGWLLVLNVLLALAVVASVWLPVVAIYKHWPSSVAPEVVEASRDHPRSEAAKIADSVMTGAPLTGNLDRSKTIAAAEAAVGGRVAIEGYPELSIRLPFDRALLEAGNSTWQLAYSGFLIPQLFLNAYLETGQERFLVAAKDFILDWWSLESSLWAPLSFVWNDHAVASRGFVLARFWHHYRRHKVYDPEEAEEILKLVRATARLLAEERLYTYRTNHGTMQDIALAKLSLFFPLLEGFEAYGRLALSRSAQQMASLINEEGVVREHSIGYHVFGLGLLSDILALSELAEAAEAAQFRSRLVLGRDFLQVVRRNDGSLPRVGDTVRLGPVDSSRIEPPAAPSQPAEETHRSKVFAKAGYAVHRSRDAEGPGLAAQGSHLLVYWGHTPYLGHKHADELSLHLWIDGVDWWTSVGYWPYFRSDRDAAISWTGANGPHLSDEAAIRKRGARLRGHAEAGAAFFLDLVREGSSGFGVRRQILAAPGGIWLVLDAFSDDDPGTAQVVWTSDSTNVIEAGVDEGSYVLKSQDARGQVAVRFLGSGTPRSRSLVGEEGATIGWVVRERERVLPAAAIVLKQSSQDSWLAKLSIYEPNGQARWHGDPRMVSWRGAEDWRLELPLDGTTLSVRRGAQEIVLDYGSGADRIVLNIQEGAAGPQYDQKADAAYAALRARYGDPFRPLVDYRARVTWVALALLAGHLLYLVLLVRLGAATAIGPRLRFAGLCLPMAAWLGVGAWLHLVYFP